MMTELTKRRVRSIYKLVRIGKVYTLVVHAVNEEKGFIDLSKKRVDATEEERQAYDDKFNNAKALNSIIRHISSQTYPATKSKKKKKNDEKQYTGKPYSMEEIYEMFGFDMIEKYDEGVKLFKMAATDPDQFLKTCNIPEELHDLVIRNLKRKLAPTICRIRADVEATCFARAGVDALKAAFKAGLALASEEFPLEMTLLAPPNYIIICATLDKEEGILRVKKAIEAIAATLVKEGGNLKVIRAPSVADDLAEEGD